MGATLELVRGAARDFALRQPDAHGDPFTAGTSPFLASDALAAKVWAGGDLPAILAPAAAWTNAGTGSFAVSLAAADTAALSPGIYRVQVTVSRGGKTGTLFDGRLRVKPAPGTGAAALAFTVRADLLAYAPWLEDLQGDSDETAFAAEQARATDQIISDLVMLWKNGGGLVPQMGQPGWNATVTFGSAGAPPSKWLRDQLVPLAPNSTPPADVLPNRTATPANLIQPRVSTALLLYPEVIEVCAKRAIAYKCKAQIGANSDKSWWELARMFASDADNLFRSYRFAIDLSVPQTGWASITVHGGASSLR